MNPFIALLDRWFQLEAAGTHVARELRAGLVTFLTLSYILFVNPQVLSATGMPAEDIAVATALASAIATLVMGLFARYPFALAPGMGLNAYFTFGVVLGMGIDWRVALAAVFVEGFLFLALSLVGARRAILRSIPQSLKLAITCGIGLFLAIIGLQNAGLIIDHPATLVTLGDLHAPAAVLALVGVIAIATLRARGVQSALLIGIVGVTVAAWGLGLAAVPESIVSRPHLPKETFLAMDFRGLLSGSALGIVLAFLFVDLFDTAGTLVGVGRQASMLDEHGELERADRAFTADAVGTIAGAALGTSTVTSYIESATGVEEGGRTGLTAVTVAGLFLLSLFFTPLLVAIPACATAPALIVVGALMMRPAAEIAWTDTAEAIPAFLTVAVMPFTYSIANGISLGIVSWVAIQIGGGGWRKVPPLLAAIAVAIVCFHAFRISG